MFARVRVLVVPVGVLAAWIALHPLAGKLVADPGFGPGDLIRLVPGWAVFALTPLAMALIDGQPWRQVVSWGWARDRAWIALLAGVALVWACGWLFGALGDPGATPDAGSVLLLAVALVGITPLVEETFFRGALWGALAKAGAPRVALVPVTSAAFALAHFSGFGDVRLVAATFIYGLGLGWLRARDTTVGNAIVAHAVINALALAALLR